MDSKDQNNEFVYSLQSKVNTSRLTELACNGAERKFEDTFFFYYNKWQGLANYHSKSKQKNVYPQTSIQIMAGAFYQMA